MEVKKKEYVGKAAFPEAVSFREYSILFKEVCYMVRLRIIDLLEERNLSKYWLWKRLGMSYDNYNKMIKNETHSIRYDIIDSILKLLDCTLEDLFEVTTDDENE